MLWPRTQFGEEPERYIIYSDRILYYTSTGPYGQHLESESKISNHADGY